MNAQVVLVYIRSLCFVGPVTLMMILLSTTCISIPVAASSPFYQLTPVEMIVGAIDAPRPPSHLLGPVNILSVSNLHNTEGWQQRACSYKKLLL